MNNKKDVRIHSAVLKIDAIPNLFAKYKHEAMLS